MEFDPSTFDRLMEIEKAHAEQYQTLANRLREVSVGQVVRASRAVVEVKRKEGYGDW